jgi:hypothetical protein
LWDCARFTNPVIKKVFFDDYRNAANLCLTFVLLSEASFNTSTVGAAFRVLSNYHSCQAFNAAGFHEQVTGEVPIGLITKFQNPKKKRQQQSLD